MKLFAKLAIVAMIVLAIPFLMGADGGCEERPNSDETQKTQQEKILAERTAAVGMPAVKNFREARILKDIIELCDQDGYVTYTYLENVVPKVVPGYTAKGGKLTYLGETIGYGIPYATQFTNPEKVEWHNASGYVTLPQADPNTLFKPASADGTWVLLKNPHGKDVKPIFVEPKIVSSPFEFDLDK